MAQKQIAPTTQIIKIPIKTESMAVSLVDDEVAEFGRRNRFPALTVDRMIVQLCSVPEQRPKRERDLPVLIAFGSRREGPRESQDVAPKPDKISHLAAVVGFRQLYSVKRRHDAPLWIRRELCSRHR
jgi:hypothetical protein